VGPGRTVDGGCTCSDPSHDHSEPVDPPPADAKEVSFESSFGEMELSIAWSKNPVEIAGLPVTGVPARPGVYIVMRDRSPIYVGLSDDLRRRWHDRLVMLRQMGIADNAGRLATGPISVWWGLVTPSTPAALRGAEHAIVRTLLASDLATPKTLRNVWPRRPFRITGPVTIANVLPKALVETLDDRKRRSARLEGNTLKLTIGDKSFELMSVRPRP
jgi:hypothetical protein